MEMDLETRRRLASMRAGVLSAAMLVIGCFALSFVLSGSELEAKTNADATTPISAEFAGQP